MNDLHKIQLAILNKLLFKNTLRYTNMKPDKEMDNNKFQFHLNKLQKYSYIEKVGSKYRLTQKGKQYATRIDTEKIKVQIQAKISVRVCCIRYKKKRKQFLMYTRLKHPFYGCQGFPAGKVKYGEKIIEAAKRELKEETNLIGIPQIAVITHYCTLDKDKNTIDDRLMFLCIIKNLKGKLISSEEGKYEWVDTNKIKSYVTKPFESKKSFMKEIGLINKYNRDIKVIEGYYFNKGNF